MTVPEYLDTLERAAPKNVPLSMLADAPLVVSRRTWQKRAAEMRSDHALDYINGYLADHKVVLVDVDGIELLAPTGSAIRFLDVGDCLLHEGTLHRVTRVCRSVDGRETVVDFMPIAEIKQLKK